MVLTLIQGLGYSIIFQDVIFYVALTICTMLLLRSFFRRISGRNFLPTAGKVVMITGCDSGFGKAAALKLSQDGYVVFAGCLNASESTFVSSENVNLHILQMDVTNLLQIDDSVLAVTRFLDNNPSHHLAAVVANAGVALSTCAEFLTMEEIEQMVNVNLLGTVRVFKAFLPVLRRKVPGDGRLVVMASIAGRLAVPDMSAYCASKASVVAFADCLRFEVASRFGMSISVIFPDFYETEMVANVEKSCAAVDRLIGRVDLSILDAYGGRENCLKNSHKKLSRLPLMASKDISPVLDAISHAIGSPKPKRYYYPIQLGTQFLYFSSLTLSKFHEFFLQKLDSVE